MQESETEKEDMRQQQRMKVDGKHGCKPQLVVQ